MNPPPRFLRPGALLLGWLLLGAAGAGGQTKPDAPMRLITLHNGPNAVDLDGDGKPDLVVVAHRENGNAHSFDTTSFYLWSEDGHGKPELEAVPVAGREGRNEYAQTTGGGADGLLGDFRLLRDRQHGGAVVLVTATRRFGESYADRQRVVFRFYRLERDFKEEPEYTARSFQRYRKQRAKKRYTDVTAAFQAELGLGPDRGQESQELSE